ncbi:unnamed protein product [Laminaria digitata]
MHGMVWYGMTVIFVCTRPLSRQPGNSYDTTVIPVLLYAPLSRPPDHARYGIPGIPYGTCTVVMFIAGGGWCVGRFYRRRSEPSCVVPAARFLTEKRSLRTESSTVRSIIVSLLLLLLFFFFHPIYYLRTSVSLPP